MKTEYKIFFGFKKVPFATTLSIPDILQTQEVTGVKQRFDYAVSLGGIGVVTGDVGSGKSTALRFAAAGLHEAEYRIFYITASSGSILELYRQIAEVLGLVNIKGSRTGMLSAIRNEIAEIVCGAKQKAILIIDEASLLRMEVFAELHTLVQFQQDSEMWLPLVLAGQSSLIDKLQYRSSSPLASRVIARSHLAGLNLQAMKEYLAHHLNLAGVDRDLFSDQAVTAIHQGSGGLLRKANHLARGALIAATREQSMTVSAEHVRLASTEIF